MSDPGDPPASGQPPAPDELARLLDRVETSLIGGERRYDRAETAELSGIAIEDLRKYWAALGFAAVDDQRKIFSDADISTLDNVEALRSIGGFDDEQMLAITRIIGQTFARLASWQGQFILQILASKADADPAGAAARGADFIEELTPVVSSLHDCVWRRQLAAYLSRVAANAGAGNAPSTELAVGFVDMAGFTTLTRRSTEAELRAVLTAFETLAADVVVGHGGQIVKTLGDEILFTADSPRDGALIALEMIERAQLDDALPQLRGGVAFGPVVSRLGDVYGQAVNIASRLTSIARTDSVLVDDVLSKRLKDDDLLVLRMMRPVAVRGYRHLKPWRLRRRAEA